jgi:glycosyltransferase involved in cell wall biosynthesis
MKNVLFYLPDNLNDANGSVVYTRFVFQKAVESGKLFNTFSRFDKKNKPVLDEKSLTPNVHFRYRTTNEIEEFITSQKYDTVFWGTGMDADIQLPEFVTPIVVIHDLRFIEVPGDKFRYLYRKTAFDRFKQIIISFLKPNHNSDIQKRDLSRFLHNPKLKIVTVSNHTKYSILLNFPFLKSNQVHVLYCPYPERIQKMEPVIDKQCLLEYKLERKEYFLIVSAGRWFKNAYRAIQALDNLASKKLLQNKKVVVLGINNELLISKVKNPGTFNFIKYAEDKTLQLLFENAYGLIYPSLQEGFGIPPLEAMQYGTPVLAAATSSITEICGSGAFYFNPYSIMEIENRILNFLDDSEFYQHMCDEAFNRSQTISIKQKEDLEKLIQLIFEKGETT